MSYSKNSGYGFIGTWCWDNDSKYSTFSITINKKLNMYYGGYFAVAYGGEHIDDNEHAFSFKITDEHIIKTKIRTGIRNAIGIIQLTINNDKLEWEILKNPKGEFYVPEKAILHRCF